MRWLRVVVDEGHELGTHEADTAVTQFIHEIAAERRWVLSGTPTTGNEDDIRYSYLALDQLQRLLCFLRHPTYGNVASSSTQRISPGQNKVKAMLKEKAKNDWVRKAKQPFLAKKSNGRNELLRVLKEIMVMHRKEDIRLPKPMFNQVETDVVVPEEVEASLRVVARTSPHPGAAMMSCLDQYLHSADFQSLVDKAQADYIVKTVWEARRKLLERGGQLNFQNSNGLPIADFGNLEQQRQLFTLPRRTTCYLLPKC
jgi:hypothetical protein